MRRREFLGALSSAAAAWPLAARAQQPAIPVVGFLGAASLAARSTDLKAFHAGLNEIGYVDGQNVIVEYQWGEGQDIRLPALASDFVRRQVAVIVVTSNSGALAAKQATATIPIIFSIGGDPVRLGLVKSLRQPGGNITGVSGFSDVLIKKRLELMREMVPKAAVIAVLVNPKNPDIDARLKDVQAGALAMGQKIQLLMASSESEIDTVFAAQNTHGAGAVLVQNDPLFQQGAQIIELAARYLVPAGFEQRALTEAGGLMSYGANRADTYRQVGNYTGRVLKGEKPADLPVQQPTKFEFVINMKTAKALGLAVPYSMQLLADEVIE